MESLEKTLVVACRPCLFYLDSNGIDGFQGVATNGPVNHDRVTKLKRALIILALSCWACQHNAPSTGTTPGADDTTNGQPRLEVPSRITESNVAEMVRHLRGVSLEAENRSELRSAIVDYYNGLFERALERGESEEAWQAFSMAISLYLPEELQPGVFDEPVAQMAERLLPVFEPRGDESRVLGVLLVLTIASPNASEHATRYDEIAAWSEEVRQALPSETERVLGLVDIYENVTQLIPLPAAVNRLSELYLQRHRLLQGAFGGMLGLQALLTPRGRGELQSLLRDRGQSVEDIVTLYIRAGRPDEVRRVVSPLSPLNGRDRELVQATRDIRSDRRRARAIAFLAQNLGREHPRVAARLCHQGHLLYPQDPTFAQCLAEVYRSLGDEAGALDYYEAMLEADPSFENYERILAFVARRMEAELGEDDTGRAREIHQRAERILASFVSRFPDRQPPVQAHLFSYLIGLGEFNAGNIDRAVERLEASVEAEPSRGALVQLGIIAERRGQAEQAIRHFRAALDLRVGSGGEDPASRAVVLGHLADAYALANNGERATTLYSEALEMLRVAEESLPPAARPEIHLERGFILSKLGRADESARELQAAIAAAPQRRATYGRLLSFYVGHGMVEPALEVFRIAFNHSELNQTWKIYYTMWIIGLQRRLGQEPDQDAVNYLETVTGDDWIQLLGRYYAGNMSYEALIENADTQGQRAEAYYYEAVLQLAQGNRAHAEELLQQVLDTDMLGYFEYEFTLLLQQELAAPRTNAPTTAATPQ